MSPSKPTRDISFCLDLAKKVGRAQIRLVIRERGSLRTRIKFFLQSIHENNTRLGGSNSRTRANVLKSGKPFLAINDLELTY